MLTINLPKEYLPYSTLDFCRNMFLDGKVPIEVSKNAVFIVGRGEFPLIWLSALVDKKKMEFQEIVRKNDSLSESVRVTFPKKDLSIVSMDDNIIVEVSKISENYAIVSKLDLRPLGFNIHRDSNGLIVGKSNIVGIQFSNVDIMIGIGDD